MLRWLSTSHGSRQRRNFLHISRAMLIAWIFPLAATPVLTRLYTPQDFAALAIFSSMLAVLAGVGSWRFDWMIPNAKNRTEALVLLVIGVAALVCISLLTIVVLWTADGYLNLWHGAEVLGPIIFLLPVALLGTGIRDLLEAWFVYEADLKLPGRARITQAAVNTGVSLVAGFIALGPVGLIAGLIASAWGGISTMLPPIFFQIQIAGRLTRTQFASAGRHVVQATFSVGVSLTSTLGQTIVPLLLIEYFSAKEVGWYMLMHRLAIIPLGLITIALGKSFWSEAAQLAQTNRTQLLSLYNQKYQTVAIDLLAHCSDLLCRSTICWPDIW